MSSPDLSQFDLLLDDGSEQRGYLVSWEGTESEPFALVIEEQQLPQNVTANQEDENYGFRDLQDAWRVSYTNFSGGEGQRRRDVSGGSLAKYHQSSGVDNSMPGELRLHHALRLLTHPSATGYMDAGSILIEHRGRLTWGLNPPGTMVGPLIGGYTPESGVWRAALGLGGNLAQTVTAMTSDGADLYVVLSGGDAEKQGVWKFTGDDLDNPVLITPVIDSSGCQLIDRMCFSGGQLYASSGGQVGYLNASDSNKFVSLSPVALATGRSPFGMVASGTWVYWGVTASDKSVVYRVQWNPAEAIGETVGVKHFEQFAELPTGFVGTALLECLGNLFICGYYRGRHGADGQGVVYMAADNGIALLCRIGEDPNEYAALPDSELNQIIAGYASEHWLYLLTQRDLYRWNVRDGGLNKVADNIGSFSVSGGSSGTLTTIPWDVASGYWPGYAHTLMMPSAMPPLSRVEHASAMASAWTGIERINLNPDNTPGSTSGVLVRSTTSDRAGNSRWHRNILDDASFADGGCLEFQGASFWRQSLELEVSSGTHTACIALRGTTDGTEAIRVYVYDANGGKSQVTAVGGRTTPHSFFLSCDAVSNLARLWVDGNLHASWGMPTSSYAPGIAYTFGAYRMGDTDEKDWWVHPSYLRWAGGGGHPPNWSSASGVVGQLSFAVVDGLPYIPSAASQALLTLDWDSYAASGELWTSISSAQMPTVDKYVTSLDVHYDPPAEGDEIVVWPLVNGIPQPPLAIDSSYDGNVASLPMTGVRGTEMQLLVQLRSGNGRSTPVFHGGSLRFSPLDNSYYLLRLDLRDARRDNAGLATDTAADIDFLKRMAENKRVVMLTSPLESCAVRVSTLQFLAAPPLRGAEVNPQGIALVKLKRVP